MRGLLATGCALMFAAACAAAQLPMARIAGGTFESTLPQAKGVTTVEVADFRLDRTPVTNAQFLTFVQAHPQWRRDRIPRLFADAQYLSHWRSATSLGVEARASRLVTRVSWFAAKAYCEARGARLPSWKEWEYVAAWEWVLDYNALLVSGDSREQGGADKARFCGEGALSTADRDNYAVLMRIAFLSSLEASYTTSNLGFRCAADAR
jgi:formylglycine-generating enzyme required for sulfatase activity